MSLHPTRRRLLAASAAAGVALGLRSSASAEAPLTPACHDGDEPTLAETEGPFFKPRSPERADLIEPGIKGRPIILSGQVLDRACRPLARALVDLWHADDNGDYDNAGFRLRGHVFTDGAGRYRFRTIVPALYTGPTRHFHVKVQPAGARLLTTQLYFPDEPMNRRDELFRRELTLRMGRDGDDLEGRFDFVVAAR
jgi:protocatechuate 3,4-dioxygenase beta subunit